jgi:hypothetical protein
MSKNGKKAIYVNSNIYAEKVEKENFTKESLGSEIPDPIRYYSSNFWTLNRNNLIKCNVDPLFSVLESDKENIITLKADKTKFYEDFIENGLLVKKFNKTTWADFIETKLPPETQIFEDYYVEFPEPINLSEFNNSIESGISFINREFVYNFYSPRYEAMIGDQAFDVTVLPTVYNILNDKKLDTRTAEENLVLSLGGYIENTYVDSLVTSNKTNDILKEYFNKYVEAFTSPETGPVKKEIRRFSDLKILSPDQVSLTKQLNNNYVPFPLYMQSIFTNQASTLDSFVHVLGRFGDTQTDLLNYIINQFTIKTKNFIYSNEAKTPEEIAIQELDIKNWINSQINTDNESDVDVSPNKMVSYSNLINYLRDNIKIKNRKYIDLVKNSAYNEVIFYKVEKRQFNFNKSNAPISTVYVIPDKSELIKYIDTQIKYATDYYYTVTAYTMVVGSEYQYSAYYSPNSDLEKNRDLANGEFKLKISINPTYKIFETQIANFKGSVFENPFTKPVVKIDQQEDKLFIRMLDSSPITTEKFEIIENSDFNVLESIRLSQDNEDPETIVSAMNNSSDVRVQIYRTTSYPTNYLSFQNKLYKTLILDKNAKSFTDIIVDNTKYYYLFRYLNNHDVPSNVSDIFEVQLINEEGYYYLDSKMIDIKMPYPKRNEKGMKRYLLIRPSIIQTQPSYNKEVETVKDISVGPKGGSVWDKPFVLKIKSNKTNRVLKFNFIARIDK